ncbi:hypothetical protein I6F53_11215 [Pseudoalteromonas sp. SWN29]|uniref:hypothetical protein n=1 Tax=Pseudoalteromonas sp. SWN29 TaxID=2792064 RepID=UPI0018CCF1ED|nr:hypothetical protein [Pseudoalteromonas sp. SWN29]MBH0027554.1 hypothetical protein [Pseudoalteromonas sp. SWN29]
MLNKIKESATRNMSSISDKTKDVSVNLKDTSDGFTAAVKQKAADTKENLKDFSALSKVKDFTTASVKTVEDIDAELIASNSQYEINNFRVSATAGVTAGMTLDIHFVKNQGAKELSQNASRFLIVKNPNTGSVIKVAKAALANKETVKIKDPKTEEVLTINAKSGKIIDPLIIPL